MKQKMSSVLVAIAILAAALIAFGFFIAFMLIAEAEGIPL